ncbi:MAG: thiopurine S-methyltransferase [Pseudomonadales bacterium]|nr:thiopurine S-methyltransferase [Pseudomonadales bacterium]
MKQTINWHQRWTDNSIRFHEGKVNKFLANYIDQFALNPGATIFFPLCGKSYDMQWCIDRGFKVIGVELSKIAVQDFISESKMGFEKHSTDSFNIYRSEHITLYQGDYMGLTAADLDGCQLVFDRAAIIAIEAFNRRSYVDQLISIIPKSTPILMISREYDQRSRSGPPFSVPLSEIQQLFSPSYLCRVLEDEQLSGADGLQVLQRALLIS